MYEEIYDIPSLIIHLLYIEYKGYLSVWKKNAYFFSEEKWKILKHFGEKNANSSIKEDNV